MTDADSSDIVLDQLRGLAAQAPDTVSRMSMGQIARKLGMTRMALYRRAGSREAIVACLAEAGVKLRCDPPVRERVIEATADLLREGAIGDLTLDAIAGKAKCSKHAIYDQFGNREGVLKAVFERYSPLASVERHASLDARLNDSGLRSDAAALYSMLHEAIEPEWPLLRAFVAEVLREPESETGKLFRDWYAPLALDALLPSIIRHYQRGSIRPIPLPIVVQAFVGPLMLHLATHERLVHRLGGNAPDRDTTIAHFSEMFFRAVGADHAPGIETGSTGQAVSAPGR